MVCKAGSDLHAKLLEKTGADIVIYPERDSGLALANRLLPSNVMDYIELSSEFGLAELDVSREWTGRTLKELRFRDRYGLIAVAIKRGGKYEVDGVSEAHDSPRRQTGRIGLLRKNKRHMTAPPALFPATRPSARNIFS